MWLLCRDSRSETGGNPKKHTVGIFFFELERAYLRLFFLAVQLPQLFSFFSNVLPTQKGFFILHFRFLRSYTVCFFGLPPVMLS